MGYRCEVDEVRSNRGTVTCATRVNAIWGLSAHSSAYLFPTQLRGFEAVGQFQGCSEFVPVSCPLFGGLHNPHLHIWRDMTCNHSGNDHPEVFPV